MHYVLLLLGAYLLYLVQVAASPLGPDLLLLLTLVLGLHERRAVAVVLAAICGLFLDLLTPARVGLNTIIYVAIAYLASLLRGVVYRNPGHVLAMAAGAAGLRVGTYALANAGVSISWSLAMSALLTIALALPAEALAARLRSSRWNTGSNA